MIYSVLFSKKHCFEIGKYPCGVKSEMGLFSSEIGDAHISGFDRNLESYNIIYTHPPTHTHTTHTPVKTSVNTSQVFRYLRNIIVITMSQVLPLHIQVLGSLAPAIQRAGRGRVLTTDPPAHPMAGCLFAAKTRREQAATDTRVYMLTPTHNHGGSADAQIPPLVFFTAMGHSIGLLRVSTCVCV